jgi:replicative DNA helicase
MKLSAPIYHLKRKAKALSRQQSIPLNAALDRIARGEGCESWSLLAARHAAASPASELYQQLKPGDLLLIGARPGLGKTLMALELAIEAMKTGSRAFFFTLEYTQAQIADRFLRLGTELCRYGDRFVSDCSDGISADYVIKAAEDAAPGTLIVIDYLQLLDLRRSTPPLDLQVSALQSFARSRGLIIAFVSQISRSYDPQGKPFPTLEDVRLANPLDLAAFDKTCFLNESGVRFQTNA